VSVRVSVSARVIDRNVGGNTRYSRELHTHGAAPYTSELLRPAVRITSSRARSAAYAAMEGFHWPISAAGDVLHYPADTGPLRSGRIPIVTTVHGLAYRHVPTVRSPRAQALWTRRVRSAIQYSDHLITVSQSSADDIMAEFGVPAAHISVIPHGVDAKFSPGPVSEPERAELASLGFPDRFVLYVGNIEPRKNLIALAAAAAGVFKRTGHEIVVAGAAAWDSAPILDALEDSPGLRYVGRLPEHLLVPAYRSASIFCFPSLYEGFGLPVLEAMATGLPVACTRAGSLAEVTGGHAALIAGATSDQIADTLVSTLDDGEGLADLARSGRDHAKRFSWNASRSAHSAVFEQVSR